MSEQIERKLKSLPTNPGVYMMKAADGRVLYVGKAASLRSRVRSYFQPSGIKGRSPWLDRMLSLVEDLDFIVTDTEVEALLLESNLIKQHRPPFNVRLTDDKHYPYLCLTYEEEFPRLIVVRRTKNDGNRYFGPYSSSKAMWQTVSTLRRLFGIRSCKLNIREGDQHPVCLDYHIGRCPGPCASLTSRQDYRAIMDQVAQFLSGHPEEVLKRLRSQMRRESEEMRFEQAARLRDQVRAIERATVRQKVISTTLGDLDAIGLHLDGDRATAAVLYIRAGRLVEEQSFPIRNAAERDRAEILGGFLKQYYLRASFTPREILVEADPPEMDALVEWLSRQTGRRVHLYVPQRGEKRRLVALAKENARAASLQAQSLESLERERAEVALQELQAAVGLDDFPERIECFDISTLRGAESVGSMVVFVGGQTSTSDYRRFRVRNETGRPDDYAMMREVLSRRFENFLTGNEKFLDLPDLLMVDGGKGQLNCAVGVLGELGLHVPTVGLAKRLEEVYLPERTDPLVLPRDSEPLKLLMRIRDEAHRFAIGYHRTLRGKTVTRSVLDEIPGIGERRKRALLSRFGSIDEMRAASIDELASVPGMNTTVATALKRHLKPLKEWQRPKRRAKPVGRRE